ncbi:MAG: hypothetical protein ABJA90_01175, partial [Ginsengibacter sp.]
INRNNYEEYFLLFADNELTDYEKIEVLKFIRENRDLEREFKMIQDTICKPDSVLMEDKINLLKGAETHFITEKNYEEIFVLYHDGELNDKEKNITELFVSKHPVLQEEFDAIRSARVTADDWVRFSGKKNLYRKEKSGRVIPLIFWRSIAAAVFLGFGVWIFQAYYQQPDQQPAVVKTEKPVRKIQPSILKDVPQSKPTEDIITKENQNSTIAVKERPSYKKEVLKRIEKVEENKSSYVKSTNNKKKIDIHKDEVAEDIQPEVAVIQNKIKNMPQSKAIETSDISFAGDIEVKPIQNVNESKSAMQAQAVSYITDANAKNENYVFYNITTEEFRKSKVGGFLKKVKRIVERNNPVSRIFSGNEKQIASN